MGRAAGSRTSPTGLLGAWPETLPDEERERVEAWLAGVLERAEPLVFSDVRKGVQSLSTLYVEDRARGALGARASAGPARRAALASFYAVLHFATSWAAVRALPTGALGVPERIVDLGCGTGAAGAGVACALARGAPRLIGIDRSGWALGEARRTWAAFALHGRARRGALPAALPRLGSGDLAVAGWMLNELADPARDALLDALGRAARRGAQLLVLEPLAGRVSPWWDAAAARLAPEGVASALAKGAFARPDWVARMDRAAGLDHRSLGARLLFGPVRRAEGRARA